MGFNTDWDVDKYRNDYESDEHWGLRRQFMVAHKNKFPEFRLVCLTQVFFNMEFLGCKYPEETMTLVSQLAAEVAKDFRDSRKDKLKRTFVGAQDAAGAKAKGAKPPPGSIEGSGPTPSQQVDEPATKVQRTETPSKNVLHSHEANVKYEFEDNINELAKSLIMVIPLRANSKTEEDVKQIMFRNLGPYKQKLQTQGSKAEGSWTISLIVNPKRNSRQQPTLMVASASGSSQREAKDKLYAIIVEQLHKRCTVIEPKFEWFQDGGTPDFIRNRQPCNKNPRSYLILTKNDTGHITPEVADKLFLNFMESSNDDMFFLDVEYTEKEKNHLIGRAQHHKLENRHFGDKKMLRDRHVCISKMKSPHQILNEAKACQHPKYNITYRPHH